MGTQQRREKEKARRTEDILDAAERVFSTKGMDSASMDDVAREAELAKGTLYLYFADKTELVLALTIRAAEYLNDLFLKNREGKSDFWDQMDAVIQSYVDCHQKRPDYFRLFLEWDQSLLNLEKAAVPDTVEYRYLTETKKMTLQFKEILEAGSENNEIRLIHDSDTTLFLFSTLLFGYLRTVFERDELIKARYGYDIGSAVELFRQFMRQSLEPRGGSQ